MPSPSAACLLWVWDPNGMIRGGARRRQRAEAFQKWNRLARRRVGRHQDLGKSVLIMSEATRSLVLKQTLPRKYVSASRMRRILCNMAIFQYVEGKFDMLRKLPRPRREIFDRTTSLSKYLRMPSSVATSHTQSNKVFES